MPAKSQSQLRLLFAKERKGQLPAGTAKHWASETKKLPGGIQALPEKVGGVTSGFDLDNAELPLGLVNAVGLNAPPSQAPDARMLAAIPAQSNFYFNSRLPSLPTRMLVNSLLTESLRDAEAARELDSTDSADMPMSEEQEDELTPGGALLKGALADELTPRAARFFTGLFAEMGEKLQELKKSGAVPPKGDIGCGEPHSPKSYDAVRFALLEGATAENDRAKEAAGLGDVFAAIGRGLRRPASPGIPSALAHTPPVRLPTPSVAQAAPRAMPALPRGIPTARLAPGETPLPVARLLPTPPPRVPPVAQVTAPAPPVTNASPSVAAPPAAAAPQGLDAIARALMSRAPAAGAAHSNAIRQTRETLQQIARARPTSAPPAPAATAAAPAATAAAATPPPVPTEPMTTLFRGMTQPFERLTTRLQARIGDLERQVEAYVSQHGYKGLSEQPFFKEMQKIKADRPQWFSDTQGAAQSYGPHVYGLDVPNSLLGKFNLTGVASRGMTGAPGAGLGIGGADLHRLLGQQGVRMRKISEELRRAMWGLSLGKSAAVQELLTAKSESDRKNYGGKTQILRRLMAKNPGNFKVDSEDKGITGLTHNSGFRVHLPRTSVPDAVLRNQKQAAGLGDLLKGVLSRGGSALRSTGQTLGHATGIVPPRGAQVMPPTVVQNSPMFVNLRPRNPALTSPPPIPVPGTAPRPGDMVRSPNYTAQVHSLPPGTSGATAAERVQAIGPHLHNSGGPYLGVSGPAGAALTGPANPRVLAHENSHQIVDLLGQGVRVPEATWLHRQAARLSNSEAGLPRAAGGFFDELHAHYRGNGVPGALAYMLRGHPTYAAQLARDSPLAAAAYRVGGPAAAATAAWTGGRQLGAALDTPPPPPPPPPDLPLAEDEERKKRAWAELDQKGYDAVKKDVEPDPTPAQAQAGNYAKGHLVWKGLPITVETAKGMYRKGVSPDGKAWKTKMHSHYGYIKKTMSEADADHVDVFLSDRDLNSETVFIVNQNRPDGSFDEHKVICGVSSADEAKAAYLENYEAGWKGLGSIRQMTLSGFKKWLTSGDTSKRAAFFTREDLRASSDTIVRREEAARALPPGTLNANALMAEHLVKQEAGFSDKFAQTVRELGKSLDITDPASVEAFYASYRRAKHGGDAPTQGFCPGCKKNVTGFDAETMKCHACGRGVLTKKKP